MRTHKLRIAIVDDDEAVRKALQRLFSAADFEGVTFATGPEFLKTLPGAQPDCLVLDLHMPGMTGLDVLRELATRGPSLPTVIITAHDEPGTERRCLAAGAKGYLCKPLDDVTLLDAVERAIT
jgi:FixJ family two-component response regulator